MARNHIDEIYDPSLIAPTLRYPGWEADREMAREEESYRRKIEAAYGMKVAIKRFLDDCGEGGNHQYRRRVTALREAMEAYCNA